MNQDILAGQWPQLQGQIRQWWDKLTDKDVQRIAGQREKLVGLLQEKYGFTRERAEEDINRHLREFSTMQAGVPTK